MFVRYLRVRLAPFRYGPANRLGSVSEGEGLTRRSNPQQFDCQLSERLLIFASSTTRSKKIATRRLPPWALAVWRSCPLFFLRISQVHAIVTGFGVEGTVPRPGNTDPDPETRGHFRSCLVKTSHEDRISFLDPVPQPHRPRIFVTMVHTFLWHIRTYMDKLNQASGELDISPCYREFFRMTCYLSMIKQQMFVFVNHYT